MMSKSLLWNTDVESLWGQPVTPFFHIWIQNEAIESRKQMNKRISGYRNKTLPVIKTKWKDMIWCEKDPLGLLMMSPSSHRWCSIRASSPFLWGAAENMLCHLTAFCPKKRVSRSICGSARKSSWHRVIHFFLPASAILGWAYDVWGFEAIIYYKAFHNIFLLFFLITWDL